MIDNEKQELEEQNYYEQIIDEHEQAEAQKRGWFYPIASKALSTSIGT